MRPTFRKESALLLPRWRKGMPALRPADTDRERPGPANNHMLSRLRGRFIGCRPVPAPVTGLFIRERNVRYFSLLLCLLLAACSQTQHSIQDTLALATVGMPDVEMDDQAINNLPYSSLYATINDGPQIFVVAAFAEEDQVKWLTSDRVLLITQNGRLVKTVGYTDNLLETTDLRHDPLLHPLRLKEGDSWTRTLSWTEGKAFRSATVTSVFHLDGAEPLTLAGTTLNTLRVEENVSVPALGQHYRNRFWIDPATGIVRKAEQSVGPDFHVNLTILKP